MIVSNLTNIIQLFFVFCLTDLQNLNFDNEYLFGFETLVFATSGILSMHNQLVTLKEKEKLEIASYDPFKGCKVLSWEKIAFLTAFILY